MALDINDPEAVRRAAHEIVSRSEFTQHETTWWKQVGYYLAHPWELIDIAFNWFAEQFSGSGVGAVIAWVFVAVLAALAIALVIWLTRSTSSDHAVPIAYAPHESGKSADDLLAEAERFEQQQRWRDAIRSRYAALVSSLGADGIVRLRPGRTTGEYEREVARNLPAGSRSFSDASRLFEWVWYGDMPVSGDDVARFRSLAESVRQGVAA